MNTYMATIQEQPSGVTLAQRAKLFNDRAFLNMFSGYAIKSFIIFIGMVTLILLTAVGVYYQLVWFLAGVTAISLALGMATASLKDFRNRVRTVRINKELIPKGMHNHFIKLFAGKR